MELARIASRRMLTHWLVAACLLVQTIYQGPRIGMAGEIPDVLKPWKDWVLWDTPQRNSPSPFDDSKQRLSFWPSTLQLEVFPDRAIWSLEVRVFDESWIALPGEPEIWPQNVKTQAGELPVLVRDGVPAIRLQPGSHQIRGEFRWPTLPQKLAIPKAIGIVALQRSGVEVPMPNWDAAGFLWLQPQQNEVAQQNLLTVKVYRVLEDGIPLWLRTQVELSVSGRSREEDLGTVLPEGWQLSSVESSLPVAVDEQGRMKVQVRPGIWNVQLDAFRNQDLSRFAYSAEGKPAVETEWIGFRSSPSFRIAEIEGLQAVDVQQTTFPEKWRSLPVYQWKTDTAFQLTEKMRGMGLQKPQGFAIDRHFWLDEDGSGITYQDQLRGELQQTWRLDVAEGHQLGGVRINQERQLITANPTSGSQGVEIRSRNPNFEALGRIDRAGSIPATGWQTDVDSLQLTLSLPPGWRVLTVFGADQVDGDWLTAWSLMDLFLVLIFSLAIYRLWGIPAGLLALFAFGLSYHEMGAPRWTWLFLLMPVALLRVVGDGAGHRWLQAWRYLALGLVLLNLLPFLVSQVEVVLYPQLEPGGVPYGNRKMFPWIHRTYAVTGKMANAISESAYYSDSMAGEAKPEATNLAVQQSANLAFDPGARTQTGPAKPEWQGNMILCRWDGPVTRDQQVTPIYIPRNWYRAITLVRCLLLLLLVTLLIRMRPTFDFSLQNLGGPRGLAAAWLTLLLLLPSGNLAAQPKNSDPLPGKPFEPIPATEMLETLRTRLLEPSDAFPTAANIASLDLSLQDGKLQMQLEVHAALEVAIPLPGKLPIWSPTSVRLAKAGATEFRSAVVGRREDGHLWMVVPAGVHQVRIEGRLPDTNEWVLAFPLPPKRVTVVSPQWQVVGLSPSGVPENQLFFSRFEKSGDDEAKYDQRVYRPIVIVERRLEIGLRWMIHNRVSRLSATGKAIALKIPLLAGERVVSSSTEQPSSTIDVNLAADQSEATWESELDFQDRLTLKAASTETYVERWVLVSSPVWNVTHQGTGPIYEASSQELIPVWQIWPGEEVSLEIRRPQATLGETVTVRQAAQQMSLGTRQRTTQLELQVETSLGGDFVLELDPAVEVNSLTVDGRKQPVRRQDALLMVPLQPGLQRIDLSWENNQALQMLVPVDAVKLPVASANVTTTIAVPENRWVLWVSGPMRGPAVRFWIFLLSALLLALALGSHSLSPLKRYEWVLLALGLTQLHAIAGLLVVAWLYILAWRGKTEPHSFVRWHFNLLQLLLVGLTFIIMGIFIVVVGKGLLGSPEMFIVGNGSNGSFLQWFEPKSPLNLPQPALISVSLWYYRLAMLLWALWLASALLRWLQSAWTAFSYGGRWLSKPPRVQPTR